MPTLNEVRRAADRVQRPERDVRAAIERFITTLGAPIKAAVKALSTPIIIDWRL